MSVHAIGSLETLLVAFAIGLAFKFYFAKPKLPHGVKFLPGPISLPILGNALAINVNTPWLTYVAWGRQYGKWNLGLLVLAADVTQAT